MNSKILILGEHSAMSMAIADLLLERQKDLEVIIDDKLPSQKEELTLSEPDISLLLEPKPQNRHERRKKAKLNRRK